VKRERPDPVEKQIPAFDAIVMAGDRGSYRPVYGTHKALLEIAGRPVLSHVISALELCRYVSRIFVVGPREKIAEALALGAHSSAGPKEIVLVEQWNTVLDNAWNTFLRTLPGLDPQGTPFSEQDLRERWEDKAVLVLGSDMPLLTHDELDEFVEGCDLDRYDFLLGTTPKEALTPYEPQEGVPGIRFAHFCFKESRERQNNLNMVRFFRLINREYGQLMYHYRYQKQWINILTLMWRLLRMPEIRAGMILRFLLLHAARVADQREWTYLFRMLRGFLDKPRIERDISALLRTRFGTVVTSFGGAALDVDNEEHFEILRLNFHRWRSYQETIRGERARSGRARVEAVRRLSS